MSSPRPPSPPLRLVVPPDVHAPSERAGAPSPAPAPAESARDRQFMRLALREAQVAYDEGEVPVGAVIVSRDGELLGKAHNLRETLRDPTAHAEMLALTQAADALNSWRLTGATIYVTLEPCPMCAGALVNARIGRLVFGAADPKAGACGSLFDLVHDERLNHCVPTTSGVLDVEGGDILRAFFRERRARRGPPRPGR